jgi:hypothetical protein
MRVDDVAGSTYQALSKGKAGARGGQPAAAGGHPPGRVVQFDPRLTPA